MEIPALMAEMQRVIHSQQQVLYKLKDITSTEHGKRQVGHSTFQVQYHIEVMLKNFERRLIVKFDELKASSGADGAVSGPTEDDKVCPALGSGKWYHWGGQYRRAPNDFEFPNKMTLKNA